MVEARDRGRIRNNIAKVPRPVNPLHPKFEDILLYIKIHVDTYKALSDKLGVAYRTIKDRVDSLVQREFLIRGGGKRNIRFYLSRAGNDYLEIYFSDVADLLKLGVSGVDLEKALFDLLLYKSSDLVQDRVVADSESHEKNASFSKRGHKITWKTPKVEKFPFQLMRFREYLEQILSKLPEDYPKDPFLLNRPHWITYQFPILQQDKFLKRMTLFGVDYKGNPLSLQTWTRVAMKNWYYYQGSLSYSKIPFLVKITPRSVMVRFQTIFTEEPLEAAGRILKFIYLAKKEIEDQFSTETTKFYLGSIDPDYVGSCILQHYGILLHPFAVICDALGIAIEDKKKRLRIDASKDVPEVETIHSWFALDDLDFIFDDIVFQVKNRYGVREAYKEIQVIKKENGILQAQAIKSENQYLALADKITLTYQRFHTVEHHISDFYRYLAETMKVIRDSQISTVTQFETLEEKLASLEKPIETYSFKKRSEIERVIITFLRTRPKEKGYSRKELALELDLPLGSISRYVTDLRKEGVILEKKEGRRAGRYFIHPTHRFNKIIEGEEINYD